MQEHDRPMTRRLWRQHEASVLVVTQAGFALSGIIFVYLVAGDMHAVVPGMMLVFPLFYSLTLTPRAAWRLTVGGLFLLGMTMSFMTYLQPAHYPAAQGAVHFVLVAGMSCVITLVMSRCQLRYQQLVQEKCALEEALTRIHSLAIRDELTHLPNRLHLRELLEHESHRHRREGQSLCMAMLDLDLFKRINDRYGHQTGDEVLRRFAASASSVLRVTDVLARWGGEEFFLFMPNTSPQAALQVLERMRLHIAQLRFPNIDPALRLSFSAGLSVLGQDEPVEAAIKRADCALYQAKAAGRNAVRMFDASTSAMPLNARVASPH